MSVLTLGEAEIEKLTGGAGSSEIHWQKGRVERLKFNRNLRHLPRLFRHSSCLVKSPQVQRSPFKRNLSLNRLEAAFALHCAAGGAMGRLRCAALRIRSAFLNAVCAVLLG